MRRWVRLTVILAGTAFLAVTALALNRYDARKAILSWPGLAPGKKEVDVISVSQIGSDQATTEVRLTVALMLGKGAGGWEVREIRLPDGGWEKAETLRSALADLRTVNTRQVQLQLVAALLLRYKEKGDFPVLQDIGALNDELCPAYLAHPAAFDAWNTELRYVSKNGKNYDIVSAGPDRKWETRDDILLRDGKFVDRAR